MKRTELRRYTPLKRSFWNRKPSTTVSSIKSSPGAESKAKRRIKNPLARAKVRLWELCKEITRKTYGNTCYTCGKAGLEGSSWQTGHFIPSAVCGGFLRYDLRNLRPQCFRCNIDLSGNGSIFYRLLVEREGQKYVDKLFYYKNSTIKLDIHFVNAKIEEYKKISTDHFVHPGEMVY